MERFCEKLADKHSIDPIFHIILTVDNVLSKEECNWIISEIDRAGDRQGWQVKRNEPDITRGLDINQIDSISFFTMSLVYTYIIPLVNRVCLRLEVSCDLI